MNNIERKINWLTYAALMSLAIGLFTSITFMALTHILILIPALYFLPKTNFKKLNMSAKFLFIMFLVFIFSIFISQDIVAGYSHITKTKYYLLAILSIAPMSYYFKGLDDTTKIKKIHYLIFVVLLTAIIASLWGIFLIASKFNPISWQEYTAKRNSGLFGNVMNYSHNLALLQVLITGMILYREDVKKYININVLYIAWIVGTLGLAMSYTRGAILSFIIAVPFYLLKKNKKLFFAIVAGLLLVSVVEHKKISNIILRQESDTQRMSQWKAALYGFKENPIFGMGYMNFEPLSISLKAKYNIGVLEFGGHAHNNYLEALAATGIVGFIFFMLWQIFWFIEMYKRDDLMAKLALPFIVAFVVGGLTQATFTLGANLFLSMTFYSLTQLDINILNIPKSSLEDLKR